MQQDTGLVRYDGMIHAIVVAEEVDEVKEIRDQAKALELYAKQANNYDAENRAARIRIRAERKCGQLLKNTKKAKGGGDRKSQEYHSSEAPIGDSSGQKTIKEMGLTHDQSSQFQQLADIDEDDFEETINNSPAKQLSTNSVLQQHGKGKSPKNPDKLDDQAFWACQMFVDFESRNLSEKPLNDLLPLMTATMRGDIQRILPALKQWVSDYDR